METNLSSWKVRLFQLCNFLLHEAIILDSFETIKFEI